MAKKEVSNVRVGKVSSVTKVETMKKPPIVPGVNEELESELEEMKEGQSKVAKIKASEKDTLSDFLRQKYNTPDLQAFEDYCDTRLPKIADGKSLRVARFYPALSLCVDRFEKNTPIDDIKAKKWEFERLGLTYTWIVNGEEMDLEDEGDAFYKRQAKLSRDPEKRIHFHVPKMQGVGAHNSTYEVV